MVTITKAEVKTSATAGKPYKSIELSDGTVASMWPDNRDGDTPGYNDAVPGASGDAEITTSVKGNKTYKNIISWKTKSNGQAVAATNGQAPATGAEPWPAKDRGMDAESAYKSASPIVVALIEKGEVKGLNDAQAAWDTLAAQAYGCMQDARANRLVYPGFDAFADE